MIIGRELCFSRPRRGGAAHQSRPHRQKRRTGVELGQQRPSVCADERAGSRAGGVSQVGLRICATEEELKKFENPKRLPECVNSRARSTLTQRPRGFFLSRLCPVHVEFQLAECPNCGRSTMALRCAAQRDAQSPATFAPRGTFEMAGPWSRQPRSDECVCDVVRRMANEGSRQRERDPTHNPARRVGAQDIDNVTLRFVDEGVERSIGSGCRPQLVQ